MKFLCALLALACASASAQEAYPSRPVHIVVPYTPATGADILARVLGPKLAERLKAGFVVENHTGDSGNIGAAMVAKSPPDGYTLLLTATSFTTNPALKPAPFDPVRDFAPVALLATGALGVYVNPAVPAKSMRELVELARAQPGRLNYASPGNGGPQHLAMELLKLEAKIDLVHVPYKGAGGAVADLVGGQVQAMISALQTVAPHVRAGRLRMLGVMSTKRAAAFPDVPTLGEQGLPGLEVETYYAMFAPAGTPPPVLARLNAALNEFLQQPEIRALLEKQGLVPAGGSPQALGERVAADLARWRRVVTAAGIKPD